MKLSPSRTRLAVVLAAVAAVVWASLSARGNRRTPPTYEVWPASAPLILSSAGSSQLSLMNQGLALLYQKNDPRAAAAAFREVLLINPTHYGATYQLAKSLDLSGRPDEARALWTNVAQMAQGYHDQATLNEARTRLQQQR